MGKRIASLFLLPDCELACRFCASGGGFDTMSPERAEGLLHSLREQGFRSVVLGGGEPLLWPHDLRRLARRARSLGLQVQISTNGVAWPEHFERETGIDRFILPLEGDTAPLHDGLRRAPGLADGHHALVLRRLAALRAADREFTIATVVTRENLHALPRMAALLDRWAAAGARIHAWHLYRFLPIGRLGFRRGSELGLTEDAFRAACLPLQARPRPFLVLRRPDMPHSREVAFFWFQNGLLQTGDWTLTLRAGGFLSVFGKKSPGTKCQVPQSRA